MKFLRPGARLGTLGRMSASKRKTNGSGRSATWGEAEARGVVDAWRESGKSVEAFARDIGVNPWCLRYWVPRIAAAAVTNGSSREAKSKQRFLPAAVVNLGGHARVPAFVVRLPDGLEVEVHDAAQVDTNDLAQLITCLRRTAG
jgi:hypothetical protein